MYVFMWVYVCECQCPQRPADSGNVFPGDEISVSCESYNTVSRKQTGVFCKNLTHSYPWIPLASPATPILTREPLFHLSLLLLSFPPSSLPFCCSLFSPSPSLLCFSTSLSLPLSLLPSLFITFLFYLSFPPHPLKIFQQLIGNYWIFWMPILRNLFASSKWKQQKNHISQYSST